jgi:hypothetical protein
MSDLEPAAIPPELTFSARISASPPSPSYCRLYAAGSGFNQVGASLSADFAISLE